MGLVHARVVIHGTRPLLWHNFGIDAIPLERTAKEGVAGHNLLEWKSTVLKTADGQLYLEPGYIFGALRDGAKHTRSGRTSLQPKITSTLQIQEDKILIDRWLPDNIQDLVKAEDQPVYLDVRSVKNPTTRGRNVRYRVAAATGWKTSFTLVWDQTIVAVQQMQGVLRDAGSLQGLGDGRTIGFGRFETLSFELGGPNRAPKSTAKGSLARATA